MKNKIVFILLLININVLGQSVPNTETFTLQNVIDVVNPTTDDLRDCLKDAVAAYFDPAYNNSSYAPDSSLLRFRNYALTYNCGVSASFSGGNAYPSYYRVSLGTSTGTVSVSYNMRDYPDLLIIKYPSSTTVVNTGFRGHANFDYGGANRNEFNLSLNGRVDPSTGVTLPNTTAYPDDGYPRISGGGSGSTSFSKSSSTETLCHVYIYAPMTSTAWSVDVGCPL